MRSRAFTGIALLDIALMFAVPAGHACAEAPGQQKSMVVAAATNEAALAEFKKAIRAKYDLKEKAFAEGDAEAIVTRFYTEDVVTAAVGDKVYRGRAEIRPVYQEHVKGNRVKVDSVNTFVAGDAGWDWADFHVQPTDAKTPPYTFAILFLWTKINGEWMCKGDYFTVGSFRSGKLAAPPQ